MSIKYTKALKQEVVAKIKESGGKVREIARQYNLPLTTLYGWIRKKPRKKTSFMPPLNSLKNLKNFKPKEESSNGNGTREETTKILYFLNV